MDQAVRHCTAGLGIWEFASNDQGTEPDVVMACAGDIPTLETLAAVDWLRQNIPDLKIRVVNVVDLMTLQPPPNTRTDCPTKSTIRCSPKDSRSYSTITVTLADPSPDLPAHQPAISRPRLQRGRHHNHALRYVRPQ